MKHGKSFRRKILFYPVNFYRKSSDSYVNFIKLSDCLTDYRIYSATPILLSYCSGDFYVSSWSEVLIRIFQDAAHNYFLDINMNTQEVFISNQAHLNQMLAARCIIDNIYFSENCSLKNIISSIKSILEICNINYNHVEVKCKFNSLSRTICHRKRNSAETEKNLMCLHESFPEKLRKVLNEALTFKSNSRVRRLLAFNCCHVYFFVLKGLHSKPTQKIFNLRKIIYNIQ